MINPKQLFKFYFSYISVRIVIKNYRAEIICNNININIIQNFLPKLNLYICMLCKSYINIDVMQCLLHSY